MNLKYLFYKNLPAEVEHGGYSKSKIDFLTKVVGTGMQILDIGCNDGFLGSLLIQKGNTVHGLDLVPDKIRKAKKNGLTARVFDIEGGSLPYKDRSFDIVILTDVIEHIFDTDSLLAESHRVLKTGGTFIISTPNAASLGRRLLLALGASPFLEYSTSAEALIPACGHIRYYTQFVLRHQLAVVGFSDIQIRGDVVNLHWFSSSVLARLFPSFSVALLCSCRKQ